MGGPEISTITEVALIFVENLRGSILAMNLITSTWCQSQTVGKIAQVICFFVFVEIDGDD